jgi:predicted MPP superfamily phosphohydrolase
MSIVSELFSNLSLEVSIIFIAGNHDLVDDKVNNTKIGDYVISVKTSLILPFKNFSNVIVFDSPGRSSSLDNNLDVGFIPYSNNVVNSLKSIENKFTKGNRKLLLGTF